VTVVAEQQHYITHQLSKSKKDVGGEMRTSGYVAITLKYKKVGNRWAAHCEELGTATFGRSQKEAERRIQEAVVMHLDTLEDVGECEKFFKDNGIKFTPTRPKNVTIKASTAGNVLTQPYVRQFACSTG
jgi:predicted RNase H-like HicB family nuclease